MSAPHSSAREPFLLRWYDSQAYDVIDRETDQCVGYVIAMYTGWAACCDGHEVARYRLRRDAARHLWERSRQQAKASA